MDFVYILNKFYFESYFLKEENFYLSLTGFYVQVQNFQVYSFYVDTVFHYRYKLSFCKLSGIVEYIVRGHTSGNISLISWDYFISRVAKQVF